MSYLDRVQDPRRRTVAIGGVAVIHGLLAYVVLAGLAFHFLPPVRHGPTSGVEVPLPPPPPPTPTPQPRQTSEPERPLAPPKPFPQPTAQPTQPPIDTQPTPGPVTYTPTPEPTVSPTPRPSFSPKAAEPKGNPANWVGTDDYPARDLLQGHEGTTFFRLTIGEDGRVGDCKITRSSGYPGLDQATCATIGRRARFEPATDATGRKLPGTWSSSVRWQIPR
jgi:protein TonB